MTRDFSKCDHRLDETEVRGSGIHGRGLFAIQDIAPTQHIGIYEGRRYAGVNCDDKDRDQVLTYVFGLSDGTFIDGGEDGNATRHINHSCEPNCVAYEIEDDRGQLSVAIEALRAIRCGEELFLDYALDVGDEDPFNYACRCGAPRCRGSMVAP